MPFDKEADKRAIEALARLGRNMRGGNLVSGADVAQRNESPLDAENRLYGRKRRTSDTHLPAEPEPTGLPWLMKKLKGALGPSLERPMNANEREAEASGHVFTGGRR